MQGFVLLAMALAILGASTSSTRTSSARLLRDDEGQQRRLAKNAHDAERNLLKLTTPYGPSLRSISVEKEKRPHLTVEYVYPRAFLWLLTHISTAFNAFLKNALPNGRSDVCVYMDDVRPGNQLRPDAGRTYYAYYYQLIDLPEHFRYGAHGWFDLAFVQVSDCEGIRGGVSSLTEQLLAAADFPWQLEADEVQGCACAYELSFACFMADEKAIKQMLAVKGAGSYKPCCKCSAIVGRLDAADVRAPLKHYTCLLPAEFNEYTYERFCASCDEVRAAWAISAARGGEVETGLGISWLKGRALPFSDRAPLYRIPESVYWDAQHSVWASGGVAQYEVNQFVLEAVRHGVMMGTLQEFLGCVRLPSSFGSKGIKFDLARRLQRGNDTHLKAFASEVLALTPCLLAFGEMVIVGSAMEVEEALRPHVTCLALLYCIQVIVFMGDRSCLVARLFDEIVQAHHELYLLLYPACRKPKLHYLRHIPGLLEKFKKMLTCWAAERHHRQSKRCAQFCFRNMTSTLITRCSVKALTNLKDPSHFVDAELGKPRRGRFGCHRFVIINAGYSSQRCSRKMRSRQWFGWCDMVVYRPEDGGDWSVGQALVFHEVVGDGGVVDIVAVVRVYELVEPEVTPSVWLYSPTPNLLVVRHERLLRAVPWILDGRNARVILPLYARELVV